MDRHTIMGHPPFQAVNCLSCGSRNNYALVHHCRVCGKILPKPPIDRFKSAPKPRPANQRRDRICPHCWYSNYRDDPVCADCGYPLDR